MTHTDAPDVADLAALMTIAIAVTAVLLVVVLILMIAVISLVRRSSTRQLESMTRSLPSVLTAVEQARLPIEVLAVLGNVRKMTYEKLLEVYGHDQKQREKVVHERLGTDGLVNRFVKRSNFVKRGYAWQQLMEKDNKQTPTDGDKTKPDTNK